LPLAGLVLLPPFLQDLAGEACALLALRQLGRGCRPRALEGGGLFFLRSRGLPHQFRPARLELIQLVGRAALAASLRPSQRSLLTPCHRI
jgi:hypothetical protein